MLAHRSRIPANLYTASVVLSALIISISIWLLSSHQTKYLASSDDHNTTHSERAAYLHLVLPASQTDDNLCKTLYSASVLGYPSPVLVNWGEQFHDDKLLFGGSHIAKIRGVFEYLQKLEHRFNDDVLLIADSLDVWFQLRPSVLLKRFHDINERANRRLELEAQNAGQPIQVRQKIVFSAQKRCWPKTADHPACWIVPESTLPRDVYGHATDQLLPEDDENPYINVRPRYLNSGMIMGQVAALRAMFERALQKSLQDSNFGSDQSIFAEIFGEQEYQRATILRPGALLNDSQDRTHMQQMVGMPLEYGIGLDYDGLLIPPTVFSEFDSVWMRRNPTPKTESYDMRVASNHEIVEQFSVAADIGQSRKPQRMDSLASTELVNDDWNSVPLHTNIYTGQSPVGIHFNAHRIVDGVSLKQRRITHWNETWFFPSIRTLLEQEANRPALELWTHKSSSAEKTTFWNYGHDRAGVYIPRETLDFESLEDICRDTESEVLRDGLGPWLDPRREHRQPRQ